MIKSIRERLHLWFGEKTGEDIITKTISTATVAIGAFILAWLYPILAAYLVFIYKVVTQLAETPRNNWRELIWQVVLLIVVGLAIAFAILFKLHNKLSLKLNSFVDEIKDEIEPIKSKMNQIELDIDQINNTLQFKQEQHKENDFVIIEKNLTHIISSNENIIHQRRFKLKSMFQGLKVWSGRFHWTGNSFVVQNPLGSLYEYLPAGLKKIGTQEYEYYYLIFSKPINRDEEREIQLNWELDNTNLKAQKRVSTAINEPTLALSIVVHFAKELNIQTICCEVTKSTPPYLVENNIISLDATFMYKWEVVEPIFGYSYTITWD